MFGLSRGILSKLGCVDISHLFPVVASAAGNLNSEIAACTTIFRFFTSLRCVQNDRGRGRCVQNDRERALG